MEYSAYKKLQEEGSSWSFGNDWGDQMEAAITSYLKDAPKNSTILDLGCGEGRGLLALKDLGFTNLFGLDISTPKVLKAQSVGLNVEEGDFNSLDAFKDKSFDYLFCSHAIEHSLNPVQVINQCLKISKNGLFITPIDGKEQPPLGESPHTFNFYNDEHWINLFESVAIGHKVKYTHTPKMRIGREIWTQWER